LNVVQIHMPSLRERGEDLPALVEHFYKKYAPVSPPDDVITPEALSALFNYPFPGNVRELENVVERCVVLGGRCISFDCLPVGIREYRIPTVSAGELVIPDGGFDLQCYLDSLERKLLVQALEQSNNVKKRAAALLGMTFRSFRYRLAKFGMDEGE
jgi:two-component system response regulator PilR (NtrC family)